MHGLCIHSACMLECMLCLYFGVVNHYCGWFVLMSVGFVVLVGAGFVWNEDVKVVVRWRYGTVGGDDCGWWCGVKVCRGRPMWGCQVKCPLGVGNFIKCIVWL